MKINIVIFVFGVIFVGLIKSESCNEFVCGSVVSKCLLTQSCQCKLSDCFCCRDCLNCMGDLYTECCSCLDMCPEHNETFSAMSPKSQIGDFYGIDELFDTLTADLEDEKWTSFSFPMKLTVKNVNKDGDAIDFQMANKNRASLPIVNCTVIYINTCLSNNKCLEYCESMGATSYRWFHDGCCECVGGGCINYGINESRCAACPEPDDDDNKSDDDYNNENDNEDMWDYGEDELNYN